MAARVITQHKGNYIVRSEEGDFNSKLGGKFMYNADVKKDYQAVGDWVVIKTISQLKELKTLKDSKKSYYNNRIN